ncbi:hypothetical protein ANANG_G00075420, partial [Anguilla anguilla]
VRVLSSQASQLPRDLHSNTPPAIKPATASGFRSVSVSLVVLKLCPHLEAVMGQVMTHVANASGGPLRVYYSTDKMTLEEIEVVYGTKAGGSKSEGLSFSVSAETRMRMKRDTRIRYIRIPTWDFGKILSEGNIYVTVFVENRSYDDDDCGMISENFFIPSDRSFIVAANHNIKFQKYAASIWEDEQGYNHRK